MKYEYVLQKIDDKHKAKVNEIIEEYKKANLEDNDWFALGDLFYKLYCKNKERKPTCPFCNQDLMWVEEMEGDSAGYHFQCEFCSTTLTLQLGDDIGNKVYVFCKTD